MPDNDSTLYLCPRCAADPQPTRFTTPRRCAFNSDGSFNPDNWNCVTIDKLLIMLDHQEIYRDRHIYGFDESLQVIIYYTDNGSSSNGFIVLTRYKSRACTDSAVHVGTFWPPRPLTLSLADAVIDGVELSASE